MALSVGAWLGVRGRGLALREAAGRTRGSSEQRSQTEVAGWRLEEAARPCGSRDVTMAVAMVKLCERACLPLPATALLGSLLSGAPQPRPAQPGSVQGQRCPAGYSPGDLGEEALHRRDGVKGGSTTTGDASRKVWAGGQALCLERPVVPTVSARPPGWPFTF